PCHCTGSLRFVHQSCLQQWIKSSDTRCCELCKYEFIMATKLKPLRKVTHTHTHTHTHSFIYSFIYTHYINHTLSYTHTASHTNTHKHTQTHTQTHTHTHTHAAATTAAILSLLALVAFFLSPFSASCFSPFF